jgi:DNA-binding MarR family transcriptional regulator
VSNPRSSIPGPTRLELEHAAEFRTELRRFLARSETATREAGLTTQRYDLLLAIKAAGGELTINELCSQLGMRQTAVTELVKRAQEAGLVVRKGSKVDRRVVLVTITSEAENRLARGFEALRADRAALAQTLELLKATLEAPAPVALHPILEPPPPSELPPVA